MRAALQEQPEAARAARWDRIVEQSDAGYDYICRGAPHVVVACAPKDRGPTDCVIALTYLELAAPAFGLGVCWDGYLNMGLNRSAAMQEALGLPEGYGSFGAMMVGYPKYEYHRLPPRNEAQISWR
jgi:nitroreductase